MFKHTQPFDPTTKTVVSSGPPVFSDWLAWNKVAYYYEYVEYILCIICKKK